MILDEDDERPNVNPNGFGCGWRTLAIVRARECEGVSVGVEEQRGVITARQPPDSP